MCVVSVCECECVYTHAFCSQHHTCYGEGIPLLKSSSFRYAFCWFSVCSRPETLMAVHLRH
uniref:Uncharacterized protein n=1 Tax=Neovison vison TaxID=452646 RepID=A0A8C7BRI8_NEOVI